MRKYAAMGLTAVLATASFPAAVLADEADVKSVRIEHHMIRLLWITQN